MNIIKFANQICFNENFEVFKAFININIETGATVTILTGGGVISQAISDDSGKAIIEINQPGTYEIFAKKGGLRSNTETIELTTNNESITVSLTIPFTATLTIYAESGSIISLSNKSEAFESSLPAQASGITTITFEVKGTYELYASKDGSISQTEIVEITTRNSSITIELIIDYTAAHNIVYRGEPLLTSHFNNIESLYNSVSKGDFKDIYIGDYITYGDKNYIVMGIDTYKGKGIVENEAHHLVIVPENAMGKASMNSSNTTTTGYAGTVMHNTTLPGSSYFGVLNTAFENHILNCTWSLSNKTTDSTVATTCKIRLLNETAVTGVVAYGKASDVGEMDSQLPGFKLKDTLKIKNNSSGEPIRWWLSSIGDSSHFCLIRKDGTAGNGNTYGSASDSRYVVPMVLFG